MATAIPTKLQALTTDMTQALITALVLTKTEPNYFVARDSNEYRGVINYTVRDSKRHLVNCKYWGSKERVAKYHSTLKIGDIIDIVCPRVVPCSTEMQQAQQQQSFMPQPTLPIMLVLNEGQSVMQKHNRRDLDARRRLWNLMRLSHKPPGGALQLADVRSVAANAADKQGQLVELLVAVVEMRPVRQVRSARTRETLSCLEVVVIDRSTPNGMLMSIWSSDWIQRTQQVWQQRQTTLHLVDVRVAYSEYYGCATLSIGARTLIYENPFGREAQELAEFVAQAPQHEFALSNFGSLPNAEKITTRMSVRQIYARAEGHLKDEVEQFGAVLFGMVTKFDIDGFASVLSKKCKSCQRLLDNARLNCDDPQCELSFSLNYNEDKFEQFFNINVHFSDHSGTLTEARLRDPVAERVLALNVRDFLQLSETQKEQLKWRLLMEHFEVKLFIKKVTTMRKNIAVTVVEMRSIDMQELSKKILVF